MYVERVPVGIRDFSEVNLNSMKTVIRERNISFIFHNIYSNFEAVRGGELFFVFIKKNINNY